MGESVWEVSRIFLKYVREGATKGWDKKTKTTTKKPTNTTTTTNHTKHKKNTTQKEHHQIENSWFGLFVCLGFFN